MPAYRDASHGSRAILRAAQYYRTAEDYCAARFVPIRSSMGSNRDSLGRHLRRRANASLPQFIPRAPNGGVVDLLAKDRHRYGAHHDLKIERQRRVADVPDIERPFVGSRNRATALDLGPTGEAGPDMEPRGKSGRLIDQQQRPGAHERHLTREYVEELWEFVEPRTPQETPQARRSLVIGHPLAAGVVGGGHSAELT